MVQSNKNFVIRLRRNLTEHTHQGLLPVQLLSLVVKATLLQNIINLLCVAYF